MIVEGKTEKKPGPKPIVPAYKTKLGSCLHGKCEEVIQRTGFRRYYGNVQLVFFSPPYPLNRKKKYGNLNGEEYTNWLASYAKNFRDLLTKDGSIVIELGNCWESGSPSMSTLALEALLAFKKAGDFNLCQQFICDNPARLPSPAQWVTIERIRVKDSYTNVWWFSKCPKPKADNRKVLKEYSESMRSLLKKKKFNAGRRPSEHIVSEEGFTKNNKGSIPSNVLSFANTRSIDPYFDFCKEKQIPYHPARMPAQLADFFVRFLTDEGDLVLDPFGGSNTTGSVCEKLKRHWVTIEANRSYIDGSVGRFHNQNNLKQYEY